MLDGIGNNFLHNAHQIQRMGMEVLYREAPRLRLKLGWFDSDSRGLINSSPGSGSLRPLIITFQGPDRFP